MFGIAEHAAGESAPTKRAGGTASAITACFIGRCVVPDPCPVGRYLNEVARTLREPDGVEALAGPDFDCHGPRTTFTFHAAEIRERLPYGAYKVNEGEPGAPRWTFKPFIRGDTEQHSDTYKTFYEAGLYMTREQIEALFTLGRECGECVNRQGDTPRYGDSCPTCDDYGTIGGVCERHAGMLAAESMRDAILWACGEGDSDFYSETEREERGLPRYWWRDRLRATLDPPALTLPDETFMEMMEAECTECKVYPGPAGGEARIYCPDCADRRAILPLLTGSVSGEAYKCTDCGATFLRDEGVRHHYGRCKKPDVQPLVYAADLERLREALQAIAEKTHQDTDPTRWGKEAGQIHGIARAALTKEEA